MEALKIKVILPTTATREASISHCVDAADVGPAVAAAAVVTGGVDVVGAGGGGEGGVLVVGIEKEAAAAVAAAGAEAAWGRKWRRCQPRKGW